MAYLWDDGDTDYVKGHAWFVTSQYQLTENMLLFGGYGVYSDQHDDFDYFGNSAAFNACAAPGSTTVNPVPTTAGCSGTYLPASVYAAGSGAFPDQNYSYTQWTVGVAWEPVAGLLIQPEWASWENEDTSAFTDVDNRKDLNPNYGRFSLRIVRSF